MSNFERLKIKKVGKVVTGKTPSTDKDKYFGGSIPFIKIPDLRNSNRFVRRTERYLTEEGASTMRNQVLPEEAVMMSCLATVGLRGITTGTACTNQQINSVICDTSLCLPKYLYYALETIKPELKAEGGGGSVYLNVSKSKFSDLKIPVPPLPVQRRIADILGALDDKIELNRRMNETLEAMAQTLYRHWFVDFGPFQDLEFMDTEELGPIPEGWETQKVKEFGEVVLGSTPSTKDEENYGSEYPFIKIPDMHGQVFVDETENYLSEKGAQSQHKRFLPADSIVVSCIATPGLVTITSQKSQTNQQINSVIPNKDILREYLYLTFDHQSRRIKRLASGGTATAILNKTDFSNVELLSPPPEVIEEFHRKCSKWFDLMKGNLTENKILAETRDYLLPKLISGEIEVDAAEDAAEEAIEAQA